MPPSSDSRLRTSHGSAVAARRPQVVVVVWVLALLLGSAPPVLAQEPPGPVEASILSLEGSPFWYGPGGDLDLRIRVTNRSSSTLGGFRLSIAAYDRVSTRFGLEASESIDPTASIPSSAFTRDFPDPVPPNGSLTVVVDDPVSTLVTFAGEPSPGVYPLTVTLLDAAGEGTTGPSLSIPAVYYPGPVDPPLKMVMIVPLIDLPAQGPEGIFEAGPSGSNPLEEAVAEGGWLRGVVSALDRRTGRGLALALAPSPRLIDELSAMSDGYRRGTDDGSVPVGPSSGPATAAGEILTTLGDVLGRKEVQPMLSPYGWADLPALSRLDLEPLAQQLKVGEEALRVLQIPISRRWILAPLGRVDEETLDRLKATSLDTARRMMFSPLSLTQPADPALAGCPTGSPTFACPLEIDGTAGDVSGFQIDKRLQDHLSAMGDPALARLALQRLLAETSMIREELPGRADRVVAMILPATLHPEPQMSHLLLKSLALAPWLETVTPNRAVAEAAALAPRDLVEVLSPAQQDPGSELYDRIAAADATVRTFSEIAPPPEIVERLRRNILVAYNRTLWENDELLARASDFAEVSRSEAQDYLDAITVLNVPEITLTSRRGEIQLLVSNGNPFPVTVAVHLTSSDLELDEEGRVDATIPADKTVQIALEATAQKSGIFPVGVSLRTPDGEQIIFGPQLISLRSTELNRVAVGITFGAFAFLVAFYILRSVRARRRHADGTPAEAETGTPG